MRILTIAPFALAAICGGAAAADLVIGVPSWSSASATSHVLQHILEESFDVDVDLKPGTNEEIFAGMDDGTIHVHPEVWLPNHATLHTEYVIRRRSVEMSPRGIPARQGICVTRHTRDEYGITSVAHLTDPDKAAIFDTVGDGLGEIWIGDPEWTSTRIERIRAHGYGYADNMQLLEADEIMATAAIDAAVAVDKPLIFYCYEPHYVFELHDIVYLDEPPYDPLRWRIIDPATDPDWLAKSNADVAWPVSFFHINYSMKLAEERPDIAAFLRAIELDVDTVSRMTYALVVERRDPGEFAAEWVSENRDRVAAWRDAAR